MEDGRLSAREKGTPQGGVISPNIFLHFAFDIWMRKTHPDVPFERYADDIVAHCRTEKQAQQVLESITRRLEQCRLEIHPEKTKVLYCKDDDRGGHYPHEKFNFLGYTFRPRRSKNRWGKCFINFTPAVSREVATKMRKEMRSWRLHLRSDKAIDDLARMWPSRAGLDSVLRQVLPVCIVSGLPTLQRTPCSLGHEIQEAETTSSPSRALAWTHCSS